ncbi:hypothetical protein ES703_105099 [subsurface metagenome]
MDRVYDIVFLGNYTRDTIVSPRGTRVVDGGAFFYGASVAARMGLKTAAVTRLAREDFRVVEELKGIGVDVFARVSPRSTCLRLEYPSSNVDERVIYVTSTAGAFLIGGSFRDVVEELIGKSGDRNGPGKFRRFTQRINQFHGGENLLRKHRQRLLLMKTHRKFIIKT